MTDDAAEPLRAIVGESESGQRLDAVLARAFGELSRSRAKELIREGRVSLGGRTIGDANTRVKPGVEIEVRIPPPVAATPAGENIALAVVYEDGDIIVIDKPAGLVVHPAAGHGSGTLVNALIAHCGESLSGIGGVRRPGIVHRLDKDTTGLLVVAKTDVAHRALSEQFAAHGRDGRLVRAYLGVCWRAPERSRGTIDAPLARSLHNRTKIAVSKSADAREAITHYDVVDIYPQPPVRNAGEAPVAALLRLELETGRTHQIRVHLAHIGHPLLGDGVYGAGFKASASLLPEAATRALHALGRQALHAQVLGFEHPRTGKPMLFESPLPADMHNLVEALRQPRKPGPWA